MVTSNPNTSVVQQEKKKKFVSYIFFLLGLAITKYIDWGGLTDRSLFSHNPGGQSWNWQRSLQKFWGGGIPFLDFPQLLRASGFPWLVAAALQSLPLFSLCVCITFLSFFYKDACDQITRPTRISQVNFLMPRFFIISAKIHFLYKVTCIGSRD